MRFAAVAADVAMGAILGVFLFAALGRLWPSMDSSIVAMLLIPAAILIVLFRQPNGSLAVRRDHRS
jgi:hypothetical protein